MSNMRKKQILWWCITIAIMLLIFWFSAQNSAESSSLSRGVHGRLEAFLKLFGLQWLAQLEGFHGFIRKCAHAIAYFSLGFSAINATQNSKWKHAALLAWSICILYAISDEVHQAFVPGRGPRVFDVILDSVSAAVGILVCLLVKKRLGLKSKEK